MEAPYFRWCGRRGWNASADCTYPKLICPLAQSARPVKPNFFTPCLQNSTCPRSETHFSPNQFPCLSCQESWLEKAFLEFWKLVQSPTAFAWSSKIIGFVSVEIPFVVTIIIINATIPSSSPQCPAHGLIVHVGLVLVHAPEPGHRLAVDQLEHPLLSVAPLDELGTALGVLENRKNMRSYISYIGFVIY